MVDRSSGTRCFFQRSRFVISKQPPLVSVAAAVAVVVAVSVGGQVGSECERPERKDQKEPRTAHKTNAFAQYALYPGRASVRATSAVENVQRHHQQRGIGSDAGEGAKTTVDYDFVVIGNGNAGSSAVMTLTLLCPNASIAVVDPNSTNVNSEQSGTRSDGTTYLPHAAVGLDHSLRTIQMSDGRTLRFRQSVLVATGARGSPPPPSLIDNRAMGRILELRSTEVPPGALGSSIPSVADGRRMRRPNLPPDGVRQMTLLAARQGANICILGSGVEAVGLAAAAARAASERCETSSNGSQGASSRRETWKDEPNVTIVFGTSGPLSSRLPRYLSKAVTKRLRQHIDVQERSLVRYVAMVDNNHHQGLEVHTAKSYDTMDTSRVDADLLVVAPSVEGQKGTAVLPVPWNTPKLGEGTVGPSSSLTSKFNTWSNLSPSAHGALMCYVDDGRIAVNAELTAASHVYAAGSVAKYPNCATGHAAVAGEGCADAKVAGEVAAYNMARDFHERSAVSRFVPFEQKTPIPKPRLFSAESVPVWRTDVCSFATLGAASGNGAYSFLSSLGIHALCIGNCDSETMATHGFWWTNQSSDNKKRDAVSILRGQKSAGMARRRSTKRSLTRRSVYGSGVVFYLDRLGTIRGVMTWGLPFTRESGNLNEVLVDRMRDIVHTNGQIIKASELSSYHLSEESKLLASIALSDCSNTVSFGSQTRPLDEVGSITNPLHRYLPSKPASITSIGMLKRRDAIGTGGVGEDIFARVAPSGENGGSCPQSLTHVYPLHLGADAEGVRTNVFSYTSDNGATVGDQRVKEKNLVSGNTVGNDAEEHELLRKAEVLNEIRSRPPKEEPLWMREGDTIKSTSVNDIMANVFFLNVRQGRFSDGSDSVQQAPVPKFVSDAKQKVLGWTPNKEEDFEKAKREGGDEQ